MKNIPLESKKSYVESGVFIVPLIFMVIYIHIYIYIYIYIYQKGAGPRVEP